MWSVCMYVLCVCCSAPEAIKTWSAVQREIFFEKRPSVSLHLFPNELNRYLDFELKGHLNTSQGKWTFAKCFWLNGLLERKRRVKSAFLRERDWKNIFIDWSKPTVLLTDFPWFTIQYMTWKVNFCIFTQFTPLAKR